MGTGNPPREVPASDTCQMEMEIGPLFSFSFFAARVYVLFLFKEKERVKWRGGNDAQNPNQPRTPH